VREFEAVDEFQIVIEHVGVQDEITVHVEVKDAYQSQWEQIKERLADVLRESHEGLRFNVELAPAGSLPRFELKAKRLTDKRPRAEFS
jgi:phenylacetate-CoA ligase